MRIAGRTAIVTGASSGIGRETARVLVAKSANVILASRNRARLEEVAVDLVHLPGRTLVVPTDVTSAYRSRRWCDGPWKSSGRSTSL
jgi:NAD(P)-dependent dehydrogenase (short-subunit alcohol dehydrogenase family)